LSMLCPPVPLEGHSDSVVSSVVPRRRFTARFPAFQTLLPTLSDRCRDSNSTYSGHYAQSVHTPAYATNSPNNLNLSLADLWS
jgi:hypothetical protein